MPAFSWKQFPLYIWYLNSLIEEAHFSRLMTFDSKHVDGVTAATVALLANHQEKVLTIYDNSKESAVHESISQAFGPQVYFANP